MLIKPSVSQGRTLHRPDAKWQQGVGVCLLALLQEGVNGYLGNIVLFARWMEHILIFDHYLTSGLAVELFSIPCIQ